MNMMSIGELLSLYEDHKLVTHPDKNDHNDLNQEQKTRIIENLLLGLATPSITVTINEQGRWELLEGEQWLKAVLQFIKTPEKALSMNQRTDIKRAKVRVNIVGSKGNQPTREYYN